MGFKGARNCRTPRWESEIISILTWIHPDTLWSPFIFLLNFTFKDCTLMAVTMPNYILASSGGLRYFGTRSPQLELTFPDVRTIKLEISQVFFFFLTCTVHNFVVLIPKVLSTRFTFQVSLERTCAHNFTNHHISPCGESINYTVSICSIIYHYKKSTVPSSTTS